MEDGSANEFADWLDSSEGDEFYQDPRIRDNNPNSNIGAKTGVRNAMKKK